jgi:cellulose biosynthesis protein BcsQ
MGKIINLFNHKGGVSKTTTVFNLAWMLGTMGKKVIVADFDPHCNLTIFARSGQCPSGLSADATSLLSLTLKSH